MKTLLFRFTQLPQLNIETQENFEHIFFAASFGYLVSLLFEGISVFMLNTSTQPIFDVNQMLFTKQLSALSAFDIQSIFICSKYKINLDLLHLPFVEIENSSALYLNFDKIISL